MFLRAHDSLAAALEPLACLTFCFSAVGWAAPGLRRQRREGAFPSVDASLRFSPSLAFASIWSRSRGRIRSGYLWRHQWRGRLSSVKTRDRKLLTFAPGLRLHTRTNRRAFGPEQRHESLGAGGRARLPGEVSRAAQHRGPSVPLRLRAAKPRIPHPPGRFRLAGDLFAVPLEPQEAGRRARENQALLSAKATEARHFRK